jgi:hypothetical protein
MKLFSTALIASTCNIFVRATYTYIAGYEPQSDVVEHSQIDLDVEEIIKYLPSNDGGDLEDCTSCDWDSVYHENIMIAWDIWENGNNSLKNSSIRSIAGFAKGAETKESGNDENNDVAYRDNAYISVMNDYWESKGLNMYTWGYDIINATFNGERVGDIDMSVVGDDFRKEVVQKGIVYLNVFPYVIWEMQDAINDCNTGDVDMNDNSVHAWDEAVAFYTGSLEGVSPGGNNGLDSCEDGKCELQFMLADKRCTNFGTCTADYDDNDFAGYSKVNRDIFTLFTAGRDQILGSFHTGECPNITDTMNEISGLMLIPFVQGVQRYLYKTSVQSVPTAKEAGELFAFASAVLPFIDQVDQDAAEMLYERAWELDYETHEWVDIKHAIEGTYRSLGVGAGVGVVTCAQVGELTEGDIVHSAACVDPVDPIVSSSSTGVPTWAIVLIVLLCLILLPTCVYGVKVSKKYQKLLTVDRANKSLTEG